MGKKRKPNRAGVANLSQQQSQRDEQTKYDVDETFADSEDEFFAGRDQILLDNGPANKRPKMHQDHEFLQPSDEEVLGYQEAISSEDDLSDTDGSTSGKADRDEEAVNLRDWGSSKADYYNADAIETEADALEEEQEARRLQRKQLQNLTDADFGFDEYQWAQESEAASELPGDTFTEQLPELEIKGDASPEEKAQIFKIRYPEFEPLARDFIELQELHQNLSLAAQEAEADVKRNAAPGGRRNRAAGSSLPHRTPLATTKSRALSAYLGTIGIYFALLTSTTNSSSKPALAKSPAELRNHPVMQSLFRSRQLWERVRDLALPELHEITNRAEAEGPTVAAAAPLANGINGINGINEKPTTNGNLPKRKRKTKTEKANIKAQEAAEAGRRERMQKTEAKLATLDTLISTKTSVARFQPAKAQPKPGDVDSDLGDEEALTTQEAAEKAQRKKSLRFYTSQIAQKSNKRGAAARDAGGDADLPYKERLKDRQARPTREFERQGQAKPRQGGRLDDESNDEEETRIDNPNSIEIKIKHTEEDSHTDGQAYYNLIAAKTNEKKAAKKAQNNTSTINPSTNPDPDPDPDPDPGSSKRAISYAISKNKGLTPHRKKEVRNPRVKKKLRYEDKMKKLASIRPVYKTQREGRGGYGGELTGIKTDLVRGVKL